MALIHVNGGWKVGAKYQQNKQTAGYSKRLWLCKQDTEMEMT